MHRALNELTIRSLSPADSYICWDRNLPAFGVRVGKRRKTFIVKRHNRYITLGHYGIITLAEARSRAKAHLYARYLPKPAMKASAAADAYLRAISSQKRQATLNAYGTYLRRLPDIDLADLKPASLYEALPATPSAANLCFNVFKAFLTWCVERSYIETNPLIKRRQPNKVASRSRLLTDEEVRLIWKESHNHHPLGPVLRTLLLTGQRINQITSLQSAWCDATTETICFPAYIMKNNADHTIPITDHVKSQIQGLPMPNSFHTGNSMNKFRAALSKIPHWTPHDFRRYFSSTSSRLGTPIDITEAILAHTTGSRSEIQRIYDRDKRLPQMRAALQTYQEHVLKVVEQNA